MPRQPSSKAKQPKTSATDMPRLWRWAVPVLGTILAMGAASATWGYVDAQRIDIQAQEAMTDRDNARRILQAAVDLESSSRGFLLSGKHEQLADYHAALQFFNRERDRSIASVDRGLNLLGESSLLDALEVAMRTRARRIEHYASGGVESAVRGTQAGEGKRATDDIRRLVGVYVADRESKIAALHAALGWRQTAVVCLIIFSAVTTMIALAFAHRQIRRRQVVAEAARAASNRRGQELAALVEMSELLQSGVEAKDVRDVVAHAARRLLPGLSGWLFAFNNSRDRLDLAASWKGFSVATPANSTEPPDHFAPSECWALKRGRPHHGDPSAEGGGLGCVACAATGSGLCVPMAARGEVQGVLRIAFGTGAAAPTVEQTTLATALGDSVSLALANQALRERLRGQALRDSLTGLHNRRFLEEVMAQMEAQLARDGRPVAVLMMDLDHFKSINDTHGHAAGDAVLRSVGLLLIDQLRRSDVACRYGGEELAVLLPGCDLTQAAERADAIRHAVSLLHKSSPTHGDRVALPPVTVSIGVAAAPQSARQLADALRAADAALYEAKRAGRNRVTSAPTRTAEPQQPKLEIVQASAKQ
jgi:diguanylate cyclase (GGDEF)-like protein